MSNNISVSVLTSGVWGYHGVDGVMRMKDWRVKVTLIRVAATVYKRCVESCVDCLCTQLAPREVAKSKKSVNTMLI